MRSRLFICALLFVLVSGCDMPSPPMEYSVVYGANGTREGMMITISTPNGTEQHRVGSSFTSDMYKFKAGEHAYISAQNQGERGKVTVKMVYGRVGIAEPRVLESTSTGGYSIATVSWLVGDESQGTIGGQK